MPSFTDSTGKPWPIQITVGAIRRVKERLAVDMLDPTSGNPPLLTRLSLDLVLLCDVLFVILQPLAKTADVTDEAFGEALGGEAITAAHEALMESWADFFHQRRQPAFAAMIEKHIKLVAMTMAAALTRVEAIDMERAQSRIDETLGRLSGNLPESPASIPTG